MLPKKLGHISMINMLNQNNASSIVTLCYFSLSSYQKVSIEN
jgi:hypothetical protein